MLQVYGDDGWYFFESDSYKVLLEALLEKQKNGEQWEVNIYSSLLTLFKKIITLYGWNFSYKEDIYMLDMFFDKYMLDMLV